MAKFIYAYKLIIIYVKGIVIGFNFSDDTPPNLILNILKIQVYLKDYKRRKGLIQYW